MNNILIIILLLSIPYPFMSLYGYLRGKKHMSRIYGDKATIETTYQNDNGILTRRFEVIEILESKLEDRSVVSERK